MTKNNHNGQPILLDLNHSALLPDDFMAKRLKQTIEAITSIGSKVILVTPHAVARDFNEQRKQYI